VKKKFCLRGQKDDENVDNYGNDLEGCNSVDDEEEGTGVEGAGC